MLRVESDRHRDDEPRYRYCPLEAGEPVETWACEACEYRPAPPFKICAVPKTGRPRRRGFWDREEGPPV